MTLDECKVRVAEYAAEQNVKGTRHAGFLAVVRTNIHPYSLGGQSTNAMTNCFVGARHPSGARPDSAARTARPASISRDLARSRFHLPNDLRRSRAQAVHTG